MRNAGALRIALSETLRSTLSDTLPDTPRHFPILPDISLASGHAQSGVYCPGERTDQHTLMPLQNGVECLANSEPKQKLAVVGGRGTG